MIENAGQERPATILRLCWVVAVVIRRPYEKSGGSSFAMSSSSSSWLSVGKGVHTFIVSFVRQLLNKEELYTNAGASTKDDTTASSQAKKPPTATNDVNEWCDDDHETTNIFKK
jgi:hypothetical protein